MGDVKSFKLQLRLDIMTNWSVLKMILALATPLLNLTLPLYSFTAATSLAAPLNFIA